MRTLLLALIALLVVAPAAAQSQLHGTVELNVIADCTQTKTYDLVVSDDGG